MIFLTTKNLQLTTSFLLPRPPRITARLSQLVFHIIQSLPQLIELPLLSVDFRRLFVDIAAVILLLQSFLRIRVVFQLGFFQLPSQNIEFLLGLCNFVALGLKPLSPSRLAIGIFSLGGVSALGGIARYLRRLRGLRSTGIGRG